MKAKYLLSILVVLLGFSIAIAPDPYTHLYMVDAFCDQTTDPEALICCEQYRDLMYAGAMLPDAMIKDYYNMGGLNYRKMHNWGNAIDLINRIQSNDIAGKCYSKSRIFHLVPDGVSHNKIVPDMMKAWMMPNELVHIPTEYAMGVSVLKHSEENGIPKEQWFQKGTSSLNALFDEDYYRFVELEQVNMGAAFSFSLQSIVCLFVDKVSVRSGYFVLSTTSLLFLSHSPQQTVVFAINEYICGFVSDAFVVM